jgi:hypothetical protein
MANTLAYYVKAKINPVKSFIVTGSWERENFPNCENFKMLPILFLSILQIILDAASVYSSNFTF